MVLLLSPHRSRRPSPDRLGAEPKARFHSKYRVLVTLRTAQPGFKYPKPLIVGDGDEAGSTSSFISLVEVNVVGHSCHPGRRRSSPSLLWPNHNSPGLADRQGRF